jgi:type IV pilus assembly protein PilQ
MIPFKTSNDCNVVSIILEADLLSNMGMNKNDRCYEGRYAIDCINFRRGDQGAGRVIVDLSSTDAVVNFREEDGKLIADFIGGDIQPCLIKRFDVTDFGTPIQNYIVSQHGNNTTISVETTGRFDKIAYQMDNQFIIEARYLSQQDVAADRSVVNYTGERISLNFQDIDLRAILQVVADFAGFNLITSDDVKGNVTLRLQNVPWDQALDIILKSKNLDKRQTGTVMMVGPTDEIANQELKDITAKSKISELGPLRSELIPLNYAKADVLQKLLKEKGNSVMTCRGSVNIDPRTNTLIVQDIDGKIAEVRALVQKLDVPVRQVEISTQIITTDNIFEKTFGIRFGGASNVAIGQRRLGIGSTMDRARATGDYGTSVPPSNVDFTGATPVNSNIIRQPLVALAPGPQVNNTEGLLN